MRVYRNFEGYADPTAGEAESHIALEAKKREAECLERISHLIPILGKIAELAGFEVVGRITLMDKKTGKKYK